MFAYSIAFLLMMGFTHIRAPPETELTVVKKQEFADWNCKSICNDANKERIANLCIKLFGKKFDPIIAMTIRTRSQCDLVFVKLKSDTDDTFVEQEEKVGFCDQGDYSNEKKCITKSKETDDLLVWDYEGTLGEKYCTPKYELKGELAPGAEYK